MTYRQVPVSYALTWIKCSIKIASTQYALFLGVGLLCTFAPLMVNLVPVIGPVAGGILGFALSLGLLRMTQKVIQREPVTFENFINMAFDARIYQRFQTYLIIVAVACLIVGLSTVNMKYMSAPLGFIAGIINWFCVYATFEDWDNATIDPKTRLMEVFHGVMNNFLPLLLGVIISTLFAGVCALLCFAPFLFFYIPMMAPINFLIFSSIFRGMDMEQELTKWTVIAEGKSTL